MWFPAEGDDRAAMPTKKGEPRGSESPSIKDPELYEKLVEDGASKQKAARISNAAATRGRSPVGRKGGKARDSDDCTVPQPREPGNGARRQGYSAKNESGPLSALRTS